MCFSASSYCCLGTGSWHLRPSNLSVPLTPRATAGNQNSDSAGLGSLCPQSLPSYQEPVTIHLACPSSRLRDAGSNIHLCSPSVHKLWADIRRENHSPLKTGMNHGDKLEVCTWTHYTNSVCSQLPKTQEQQSPRCCLHDTAIAYLKYPGSLKWQEENEVHIYTYKHRYMRHSHTPGANLYSC